MKGPFLSLIMSFLFTGLSIPNSTALDSEEISFNNGDITLSGTLILPKGKGPFPGVVFVHGSGPETRKNSKYSAKWFASIGYAALIYDKRGTGESEGDQSDYQYFNFEDLAGDVLAAIDYLSQHELIDKNKLGIHASSQGGWVASLAAAKTEKIRFMVIKSASVCTVAEDRIFERGKRLEKEGFSKQDLIEAQEMQKVEPRAGQEDLNSVFNQLFKKNLNRSWFNRVYPGNDPLDEGLVKYRTWYATIAHFDPIPYLKQSDAKIFWIFGDPALDHLGPVEKSINNLQEIEKEGKEYEVLKCNDEGHNIKEKKYELDLFKWLVEINDYPGFKFKKH